jgi:hypothetical protein
MPPTTAWNLDGLRRSSRLLFGSPHRLPVAVLTAEAARHELYANAIAEQAGIARKDAVRMLEDWRAAGLLMIDDPPIGPRPRGRQPQYLWRCEDQFWSCMLILGEDHRRTPAAGIPAARVAMS